MGDPVDPSGILPKDAPADLRAFLDCTGTSVTLKDGKLTWLPGSPTLTITQTSPTTATVTVSKLIVSVSAPVSIENGQLSVDTSAMPDLVANQVKDAFDADNLNAWLKAKKKQLGAPTFGKGQVTLTKIDLKTTNVATDPAQQPVRMSVVGSPNAAPNDSLFNIAPADPAEPPAAAVPSDPSRISPGDGPEDDWDVSLPDIPWPTLPFTSGPTGPTDWAADSAAGGSVPGSSVGGAQIPGFELRGTPAPAGSALDESRVRAPTRDDPSPHLVSPEPAWVGQALNALVVQLGGATPSGGSITVRVSMLLGSEPSASPPTPNTPMSFFDAVSHGFVRVQGVDFRPILPPTLDFTLVSRQPLDLRFPRTDGFLVEWTRGDLGDLPPASGAVSLDVFKLPSDLYANLRPDGALVVLPRIDVQVSVDPGAATTVTLPYLVSGPPFGPPPEASSPVPAVSLLDALKADSVRVDATQLDATLPPSLSLTLTASKPIVIRLRQGDPWVFVPGTGFVYWGTGDHPETAEEGQERALVEPVSADDEGHPLPSFVVAPTLDVTVALEPHAPVTLDLKNLVVVPFGQVGRTPPWPGIVPGPVTVFIPEPGTDIPPTSRYDQWRILARGPIPDSVLNAYRANDRGSAVPPVQSPPPEPDLHDVWTMGLPPPPTPAEASANALGGDPSEDFFAGQDPLAEPSAPEELPSPPPTGAPGPSHPTNLHAAVGNVVESIYTHSVDTANARLAATALVGELEALSAELGSSATDDASGVQHDLEALHSALHYLDTRDEPEALPTPPSGDPAEAAPDEDAPAGSLGVIVQSVETDGGDESDEPDGGVASESLQADASPEPDDDADAEPENEPLGEEADQPQPVAVAAAAPRSAASGPSRTLVGSGVAVMIVLLIALLVLVAHPFGPASTTGSGTTGNLATATAPGTSPVAVTSSGGTTPGGSSLTLNGGAPTTAAAVLASAAGGCAGFAAGATSPAIVTLKGGALGLAIFAAGSLPMTGTLAPDDSFSVATSDGTAKAAGVVRPTSLSGTLSVTRSGCTEMVQFSIALGSSGGGGVTVTPRPSFVQPTFVAIIIDHNSITFGTAAIDFCHKPYDVTFGYRINGIGPDTPVVVKQSGPETPSDPQTYHLTGGVEFSVTYHDPGGPGVWSSDVLTINGAPPPFPAGAHESTSINC